MVSKHQPRELTTWWQPLALGLLALLCYTPSLGSGFVYDDQWTIVHNSAIRSFETVADLFSGEAVARGIPDAWRPLMVITQLVDFRLFGLKPAGHHLHNILWHFGCVLMLWLLVRRVFQRGELAFVTAALFALHPIHVEAVAAINYREDLLATFFSLSALTVMLGPRGRSWRAMVAGPLLLACGLLAKGSAAVTPLLYCVLCTFTTAAGAAGEGLMRRVRPALPGTAALLVVVALFVIWRVATAGSINPYPAQGITPGTLSTHAEVLARSMVQLVVPTGMSPEYSQPLRGVTSVQGLASLGFTLGVIAAAIGLVRRGNSVEGCGLLLLLLGWLPTSGLLPLPNLRADRYLYLPSVGFCLLAASLFLRIGASHKQGPDLKRIALRRGTVAVALVGLAVLCVHQQRVWRSDLTLWTAATEAMSSSGRAWAGLARAQEEVGRPVQAHRSAERAVALEPSSGDHRLILANVLARRRRFADALPHYRGAEALGVRHPGHLYASWGLALHLAGKTRVAEQVLRRGIDRDPGLALTHANLGRVLMALRRNAEAGRSFRRAIELSPERASFRRWLRRLER